MDPFFKDFDDSVDWASYYGFDHPLFEASPTSAAQMSKDISGSWNSSEDYSFARLEETYRSDDNGSWLPTGGNWYLIRSPTLTQRAPDINSLCGTSEETTTLYPGVSQMQRTNPPGESGQRLQLQKPRFEGDLYTAPWVRGESAERAGWCGFCSTWHKLKDSAFNYHMQYTHGVSCATGRQVDGPQRIYFDGVKAWKVLCGGCGVWLDVDRPKARTTYYRHAHKCHANLSGRTSDSSLMA